MFLCFYEIGHNGVSVHYDLLLFIQNISPILIG